MPVLRRAESDSRTNFDAEAIARLAERQRGAISRKQLLIAGVGCATVARWLAAARLHPVHPGVYAVGHAALSLDGRLNAALLYAGDQAVFSHTTAAWLWSLIETEPKRIHLTVPGRRSSLPDVRVHHSRRIELPSPRQKERTIRPELPVTSVERALIDLAAIKRDREREMALRSMGFRVVRYTWDQITRRPDRVIADLRRLLGIAPNVRPRGGPQ